MSRNSLRHRVSSLRHRHVQNYGVASVSRIDNIESLFCKRALHKRRYSAKENYNLIDPTNVATPHLKTRYRDDF